MVIIRLPLGRRRVRIGREFVCVCVCVCVCVEEGLGLGGNCVCVFTLNKSPLETFFDRRLRAKYPQPGENMSLDFF